MNLIIDVLKLVFSINIMFAHSSSNFGEQNIPYFQGAFILVEWFFIFSGYTLSKKILSQNETTDIAKTSFEIIWKRIMRIFPYYFLSCTIALVLKLHTGAIAIKETWDIYKIVHCFLFLQMTGISCATLLGTEWFLSSMWIAMIILVPLLVKYRKWFARVSILIAILIYYYIYKECGYMYHPDEWMSLGYKGNLRAIAAICIGISTYYYSSVLKLEFLSNVNKEKKYLFINMIALFFYSFILFHINRKWIYNSLYELSFFIIPFIFMILIFIQMKYQVLRYSNTKIGIISSMSMIIYMNHFYVQEAIQKLFENKWSLSSKVIYSSLISIGISLIIYLFIYLISSVKRKIKK